MKLTEIFNQRITADSARLLLARWYNQVEAFGETGLNRVLETFENHYQTIVNYFLTLTVFSSANFIFL